MARNYFYARPASISPKSMVLSLRSVRTGVELRTPMTKDNSESERKQPAYTGTHEYPYLPGTVTKRVLPLLSVVFVTNYRLGCTPFRL